MYMFWKTMRYYKDSSVTQDVGSKGIGSILLMHCKGIGCICLMHIHTYQDFYFRYVFWKYQSLKNITRFIHYLNFFLKDAWNIYSQSINHYFFNKSRCTYWYAMYSWYLIRIYSSHHHLEYQCLFCKQFIHN